MDEIMESAQTDVQEVQSGQGTKESSTTSKKESGQSSETTFTQDQVNRMMSREKKQGRNAAYREMGIDPDDPNSKNMMNMFRAFMQSVQNSEQQATTVVAEQQIKVAEAEARATKAEAKAEAMQLGLLPQYVDDAVVIIMSKLTEDTDVKTIVSELKTKYPVWFAVEDEKPKDKNVPGQSGTGSSIGNVGSAGGQNGGVHGIGARLAASKKAMNKNSTYWNN